MTHRKYAEKNLLWPCASIILLLPWYCWQLFHASFSAEFRATRLCRLLNLWLRLPRAQLWAGRFEWLRDSKIHCLNGNAGVNLLAVCLPGGRPDERRCRLWPSCGQLPLFWWQCMLAPPPPRCVERSYVLWAGVDEQLQRSMIRKVTVLHNLYMHRAFLSIIQ